MGTNLSARGYDRLPPFLPAANAHCVELSAVEPGVPVTKPIVPVANTGVGLPLAGSALVRFDFLRRGAETVRTATLDDVVKGRLTATRSALCGLTLDRPRVMGILNVTPDSFSDGGNLGDVADAVARARAMVARADILDIGGESTRPGAQPVREAVERARVVPVITEIRAAGVTTPISIDTRKAAVAAAALEAGADFVNDVSAGTYDSAMLGLVAERAVPVCLMHAQGDPQTMQNDPRYGDVVAEVMDHIADRIAAAEAAGIQRDQIVIDPGIGFGKTQAHNLTLLRDLAAFHALGPPLLVGASRKRFIGTIGRADAPKDRLGGSLAVALHAALQGAHLLRVHDTIQTTQALRLMLAVNGAAIGTSDEGT